MGGRYHFSKLKITFPACSEGQWLIYFWTCYYVCHSFVQWTTTRHSYDTVRVKSRKSKLLIVSWSWNSQWFSETYLSRAVSVSARSKVWVSSWKHDVCHLRMLSDVQIEVFAMRRSLVQGSPTECVYVSWSEVRCNTHCVIECGQVQHSHSTPTKSKKKWSEKETKERKKERKKLRGCTANAQK